MENQSGDNALSIVRAVLEHPEQASGELFNTLLSLLLNGAPVSLLEELMTSKDPHFAGSMFIAEELGTRATPVLDAITPFVHHSAPEFRKAAYAAIAACADGARSQEFSHVVLGLIDADRGCRELCAIFMMQANRSQLVGAANCLKVAGHASDLISGLDGLTEDAPHRLTIETQAEDSIHVRRLFALIAAGRRAASADRGANCDLDDINSAASCSDQEIRSVAVKYLKFLEIKYRHRRPG